ncbi:hypothetical protein GCM10027597_16270 [Saccharopolyspora tripterygii]
MINSGSARRWLWTSFRGMSPVPAEQTLPMPKVEAEALADYYDTQSQSAPADSAPDEPRS